MVASVGAGPFETSAVYVVDSASGVRWRLPREEGGFSGPFWAPPALSPEGDRAYLATWAGPGFNDPDEDRTRDGLVLALNLDAADDAEDEDRILWQGVPVSGDGDPLYVRTLSVGVDGALYLGGMARERMDAWVVAYAEDGTWLWGTLLDREDTELVRGLALDEDGDGTLRILATTGHRASSERGGRLHALSPATGEVIWTFDPEDEGGRGAPSGLAVDVAGSTYFATQGAEGRGRVFSVAPDGDLNWKFCHENYEGAHPVITPEGDVVVGEGEPLLCALTAPLSNTCRARATDRKVRVFYADADAAPDKASRAFQCCRCSAGAGGSGGALWMVLLLLVHRRRLR